MVKEKCGYVGSKKFLHQICEYQFKKIKSDKKLYSETQSTIYSLQSTVSQSTLVKAKVKQSRYRLGVAQRVPGS